VRVGGCLFLCVYVCVYACTYVYETGDMFVFFSGDVRARGTRREKEC